MNNPETLATLGPQDRTSKNTKPQHNTENKKDKQHRPHQKLGDEFRCSQRESSSCLLL